MLAIVVDEIESLDLDRIANAIKSIDNVNVNVNIDIDLLDMHV
jgi:hypothetical protein